MDDGFELGPELGFVDILGYCDRVEVGLIEFVGLVLGGLDGANETEG